MEETDSAKIRILLLDKDDAPVADTGITVSVEGSSAESVTDMEGRASFPKVRVPAQIGISIDVPGKKAFETAFVYETADEENVIRLPFHIERKGILCVKVEDSNGNALKRRSVRLEMEDGRFDDLTDDEGKSVFSDIPIGKRGRLSVRCQGDETIEKKITLESGEETVTIVSEAPVKSRKKQWVVASLVAVACIGVAAYLMFRSEPTDSRPPVKEDLAASAPDDCRCKSEIEALRREIDGLKMRLSEIQEKRTSETPVSELPTPELHE